MAASSRPKRTHQCTVPDDPAAHTNGRCKKDAAGPALARRTDAVGKKRDPTELWKARAFRAVGLDSPAPTSSATGLRSRERSCRAWRRDGFQVRFPFLALHRRLIIYVLLRTRLFPPPSHLSSLASQDGEPVSLRLVLCLRLGARVCRARSGRHSRGHHLCERRCGQRSRLSPQLLAKLCLDGSAPAYHLARGFGSGVNSWLVHFEGGGWCNNVTTCLERKRTRLGSSMKMAKQIAFSGILSDAPEYNPDFYNWNKVKVRYCDGSSFTGDVDEVNPATKLHYRGARIWEAVMEDLLAKGMNKAENGSAKNLPSSCTSMFPPGMCFFPQNEVKQIRAPLFILNAAYDSWQVRNILIPGVADRHGKWRSCKHDIDQCSAEQLQILQGFRDDFLKAVEEQGNSASRGLFINSCFVHCQSEIQELWFASDSPMLGNTTIGSAVGDWFFDRGPFQKVDCPYPCDSTCHNRIYEDSSET
ncbi:hypothetical protein EJB05_19653, partial [Eragrostis curvula]